MKNLFCYFKNKVKLYLTYLIEYNILLLLLKIFFIILKIVFFLIITIVNVLI